MTSGHSSNLGKPFFLKISLHYKIGGDNCHILMNKSLLMLYVEFYNVINLISSTCSKQKPFVIRSLSYYHNTKTMHIIKPSFFQRLNKNCFHCSVAEWQGLDRVHQVEQNKKE